MRLSRQLYRQAPIALAGQRQLLATDNQRITWQSLTVTGFPRVGDDDLRASRRYGIFVRLRRWPSGPRPAARSPSCCAPAATSARTMRQFTPYTLAALREAEQKNACDVLGIKHIEFLRHDDSRLVADLTLRRELVHLIRKYKPEVVFCGDPNLVFWGHESHQSSRSSRGGVGGARCDLPLRLDGTVVARRRSRARSPRRLRARLRASGHLDRRQRHDRVEDQGAARASLPARWDDQTSKR